MLCINLQLFAHKKGMGSTKNGRDSESKRLGAKRADGQHRLSRQHPYILRGVLRFIPGVNVGSGGNDSLFALVDGTCKVREIRQRARSRFLYIPVETVEIAE